MRNVFVNFYLINRFDFLSDDEGLFCYHCGAIIYTDDEICKTDRFGRVFCGEKCRKSYYGGTDK